MEADKFKRNTQCILCARIHVNASSACDLIELINISLFRADTDNARNTFGVVSNYDACVRAKWEMGNRADRNAKC